MTTLINVYTARGGFWSVTAIATGAVTGSCTLILGVLFLVYDRWKLGQVKKEHYKFKGEARKAYMETGRGRQLTR